MKPSTTFMGIGLAVYLGAAALIRYHYSSSLDMGETSRLSLTADYVKNYEGSSINELLTIAKDNVHSINARGTPALSKLENKIDLVNKELAGKNSPIIYQPVIKSLGNEIDNIAIGEGRNGGFMAGGIIVGFLGTFLGGLGLWGRGRPDDNWD